ncbi:MAG: SpoIIE family protein phosphatase [Planctomycetia bacterium]|nr:SpoIIE family protein phosphatase [Planctomycetia bacterium]
MKLLDLLYRPVQNPADLTMRQRFLHSLCIYVVVAFLTSMLLALSFETHSARREAQHTIEVKINTARLHAQNAYNAFNTLKDATEQLAIKRARACAMLLAHNNSLLDDVDASDNYSLATLTRQLDINELEIVDANGICIAAYPEKYTGFNYNTSANARDFLRILDDPSLELAQDIRQNEGELTEDPLLYCAVARQDAPGFIEVGIKAEQVNKAYNLVGIEKYVDSSLGRKGFLALYCDDKLVLGDPRANTIDLTDLKFGSVFPLEIDDVVYFAYAQREDNLIFLGVIPQIEIFASNRFILIWALLGNFFLFLLIFFLLSFLVQGLLVKNVRCVNGSLEKITLGDLNERVNVKVSTEFVVLSDGLNSTVDSLKQIIDNVKKQDEDSISLARRIQEATLPNLGELLPERRRFDVAALTRPMVGVGGDSYDVFYINDSEILFYVADVSGHGVPAALVMMRTTALVKNIALSGYDLAKVVSTTNRYLSDNNNSSLVAAFFCSFNLCTGVLTYVNAGHIAPLVKHGAGEFVQLQPNINLVLGVDPDATYTAEQIQLAPGDAVLLFTDGVCHAENTVTHETFNVERIISRLNRSNNDVASDVLANLTASLDQFCGSREPNDDQTLLFFRFIEPFISDKSTQGTNHA